MLQYRIGDFTVRERPGEQDEETRALNELRAEGVVTAAHLRTDGQGLVGIVQGTDLADIKAHLARLPFVANGLMAFEYAEVVPL